MEEEEQRAADEKAAADAKAAEEAAAADAEEGGGGDEQETHEETKARLAEAEAKVKKTEEVAANQKARAEKAEKAAKAAKPADDLSSADVMSLMNAKVSHEDDIAEVKDYAKLKGITIAEALKVPMVQSLIADSAEKRKTAEATHSGPARRNTQAPSDEAVVAEATKGNLPDDPAKLAESRMALRKKDKANK